MVHKILFVDDEENILKALKRLFHKSGYETFFAPGGEEALKIIKENKLSVIVSDMRMPEMNGVELIRKANKIDKVSVKIILSGYSDITDIMKAVNEGHIHSYITKPWKETDLMITLMNACELYDRKTKEIDLMKELEEKNEELAKLNHNLEKIIESRTWQIKANNTLLHLILRGAEEKEVLSNGALILSKVAGNHSVTIHSIISGNSFGNKGAEEITSDIISKIESSKKPSHIAKTVYQPLMKRDKVLGILAISGIETAPEKILKSVNQLLSPIILFLSQQASLKTNSDFIGSIDTMLGEMDDI